MRSSSILLLLLVSLACVIPAFAAKGQGTVPGTSPGLKVDYAEHYPDVQPGLACVGEMVDVSTKDGKYPPNAKLALSYMGQDASRYGVKNLRIYWYDPKKKAWDKPLESTIDDKNQIVSAGISRLGTYAIGAMPVGDKEAPQVLWLLPRPNEVISGTTQLLVTPRDNVGVFDLHFLIETGEFERELGSDYTAMDGSWGVEADFSPYKTGDYTIRVEASDAEGNIGTAKLKVRVESKAQAPGVAIVSGPTFDRKSGAVLFTGTVSMSGDKMVYVDVEVDGGVGMDAEVTGSSWRCAIPPYRFGPGKHVVNAVAMDENANRSKSKPMEVSLPLSALLFDTEQHSPQLPSTPVTLVALVTGGSKVEYKFEVNDGKAWTTIQDFGPKETCVWTPAASGKYSLRATAQESGTQTRFTKTMRYVIGGPLTGVTMSVSPKPPQTINTMIVLEATATGGAQLEYMCEVNDGKGWEVFSDWYWANGGVWFPERDGTYTFRITVREKGSTKTFTAEDTSGYVINTVHDPVAAAKLPDGTWVQFSPMVVAAVKPGEPMIIQVKTPGSKTVTELQTALGVEVEVKVGQTVDVCGQMATDKNGKRYVSIEEQGWVEPIAKPKP